MILQDFYLAKRYYDTALETNNEAYFPVALSLIKLHVRSLWHTMKGGKDGLSFWNDDCTYTPHFCLSLGVLIHHLFQLLTKINNFQNWMAGLMTMVWTSTTMQTMIPGIEDARRTSTITVAGCLNHDDMP